MIHMIHDPCLPGIGMTPKQAVLRLHYAIYARQGHWNYPQPHSDIEHGCDCQKQDGVPAVLSTPMQMCGPKLHQKQRATPPHSKKKKEHLSSFPCLSEWSSDKLGPSTVTVKTRNGILLATYAAVLSWGCAALRSKRLHADWLGLPKFIGGNHASLSAKKCFAREWRDPSVVWSHSRIQASNTIHIFGVNVFNIHCMTFCYVTLHYSTVRRKRTLH